MLSKIPTNWNEVTVEQFIELKQVDKDKFHSILSLRMEQLYIVTETGPDDSLWEDATVDDLETLFKETDWLSKQPTRNFKKELELNSNKYYFKGLSTLTLGEFIDLEYYFSTDYIIKLPQICSILYRKQQVDNWGHIKTEPRTYNESERANLFIDLKIVDIYGVLQEYLTFKKNFIDSFEDLFMEPEPIDEEYEKDIITQDEQSGVDKQKMMQKWAWERVIYRLGSRSILNFDKVTDLGLTLVFNHLSMLKDLKIDD